MSEKILAGRYEIMEKIGDGGMAVVYKGRDRLLNRFVAIKVLRPEYTKDSSFVENFKKESQAAARLNHPSIVNVYDVGKESNVHYIVMELVEGKTLSEIIREDGPMDYKRAIGIAKQIASALSMAHKNNIIHRDVKPHNVLIMPDGSAKITDFGIAKAITDATLVGKGEEMIMGSVHYFSPEQARGGYVDEKSDIYSLGIVLYEMLTGKVPFDAENPVTVAVMHMNDKPTPPSQLVSGIPPGLEQIIMKATEKYQINRFKTADDMCEALDNVNLVTGIIENPVVAELLRRKPDADMEGAEGPENPRNAKKEPVGKKNKMKNDKTNKKAGNPFTRVRILAIVLALVCAVPVSYFIYAGIQSFSTSKTITVPHLEGYTEEEATEMLEELGLKLAVREIVSSYEVEEGKIVSQDRPAESQLKEGTTVRVNISRGAPLEDTQPDEVRIPNVVGRTLEEATHILNTYGYQEGAVSHAENSLPKGLVVSQNPDANTDAEEGTKVSLTVSDGPPQPKTVLMPNLFRLSEEQAKQQLEKAGLSVGTVTGEPNSIYAEGEVIWQQYEAETEIDPGASVDFKFSTGAPSLEPQTVGINIGFEEAANEVFNLSVLFSDSVTGHTSTLVSEELKYKSDGSVSVSVTGQDQGTLYVLFDGVQVKVYTIDFTTGTVSQ